MCTFSGNMNEFKTKISSLINTINTLDSNEKNEAFDYLKNFVSRLGNNVTSDTTSEGFNESSAGKLAEQNGDEAISCPKCNRLFATKVELYEHLKEYTDNGPLSCKICRSVFNNFEVFSFHKREQFCQLEFERFLKNRKKKYICECCKELFSNKKSYQLHTLQEHAKKVKKANGGYICKLCNSSFRQKRLFFRHYRKSHCEDESVPDQNGDAKSTTCSAETVDSLSTLLVDGDCVNKKTDTDDGDLVKDKRPKFQCAHCSKNFAKKNLLSNHLKFHFKQSGLICVTCKRTFLKYRYYKDHLKSLTHRNNLNDGSEQHIVLFQCKTCNKTFANEDSLTHHTLRLHSATRKLICCHLCDFKTTFPTNLKRHIRFHTSYRKFVCEECGSCFHTSSALKDHKIYLHTTERNYSCEKCGQTFKLRSGLNRHFKTHSDERNEKCNFCGQLFKLAANLRKHQLVVHGKTDGTNQKVQKFIRENDGYVINSPKMVKLRQRITSSASASSSSSSKANNKIIEVDKNIDDVLDIQPMSVLGNVDLSYTDDVLQNVTSYNFSQFPVDGEDNSGLIPERNITPIHVVEAVLQPSDSGIVHCLPHDSVPASCYSDDQHLISPVNEHHKVIPPQYNQHQQYNSLPPSCGSSYFQQLFYVNRNVNHFVNANNPVYDVNF